MRIINNVLQFRLTAELRIHTNSFLLVRMSLNHVKDVQKETVCIYDFALSRERLRKQWRSQLDNLVRVRVKRGYGRIDGRTDIQTNGRTDIQTDGRISVRTDIRTDGYPDGRTDIRTDGREGKARM